MWNTWLQAIALDSGHPLCAWRKEYTCINSNNNNNNNNRFTQAHNSLTVNVLGALWFTTETVIYSSKRCVLISCWATKKLIQVEVTEYATTSGGAVLEFVLSAWNMTCNKITFKHTSIVLGVPSETFLMELPVGCCIQCAIWLLTSPIFMLVIFTSKIMYHTFTDQ